MCVPFTLLPMFWFRVLTFDGPWPWVSRGSVSLVFALVKGEGYSPAHEGIRRVGAPSTQRPCGSGQVDIRAHPPVEPARDHQAYHTSSIHCPVRVQFQSRPLVLLRREARRRGVEERRGGEAYTPCHPGGAHRGCPRGDGLWQGRGATGRIHRAIPEERIEDARHAAGERDDGDVLAPAGGDAQGPGSQFLGLRRVSAQDGDGGLNQEPAGARVAGLGDGPAALGLAGAVLAGTRPR